MNCFRCGAEVIWQGDSMLSDVSPFHENDDEAIVSSYHCPNCGADYEVYDCPKEERSKYNHWKEKELK